MDLQDLSTIKSYLIFVDSVLEELFNHVDAAGFEIHSVMKKPYPALIGSIIGQKISYVNARKLRSQLYSEYGTDFTPDDLLGKDLSYLGSAVEIITNVTTHILNNHLKLESEDEIRSLIEVKGIGPWTITTTLLTCMNDIYSPDLFPLHDKFLETRIKRLYGKDANILEISGKWSPYRSIVTWYLWRYF
jgi:DNA-3-methyladenine glycosylase II